MNHITELIIVIIIIATAMIFILRKFYKKVKNSDGCEKGGCKDCPLKRECDTKKQINRK